MLNRSPSGRQMGNQMPSKWQYPKRPSHRLHLRFFRKVAMLVAFLSVISLVAVSPSLRASVNELLVNEIQADFENHSSAHAWDLYHPLEIFGYNNGGKPVNVSCESLLQKGKIWVQEAIDLHDNLTDVAISQYSHPMIAYPDHISPQIVHESSVVEKYWSRLSGSSVWLEQYGVYMTVTRVIFITRGLISPPHISFLRAQVYDEDWNHLDKYAITWKDNTVTFPLTYDIGTEWEKGGFYYGPEDPRIIIEDGVKDAEPVVVFNMKSSATEWKRAMWIFRPFSRHLTVLTIRGQLRGEIEKNWSPFFMNTYKPNSKAFQKLPSQHIHFVYAYHPLRVLYCNLVSGGCDMAYSQEGLHDGLKTKHSGNQWDLKGGTNLVPIPLQSSKSSAPIRAWVGLPRTHIDYACDSERKNLFFPLYRPMLVVMLNIGSQFYLTFASGSIGFDTQLLGSKKQPDACLYGRVITSNSIARWDHSGPHDVMTITLSVDDTTVQVIRTTGILKFIQGLPWTQELLEEDDLSVSSENFLRNMEISAVGNDVQHCAIEAATNYATSTLQKQREIAAWKKQEQENLQKESEARKAEGQVLVEKEEV